MLKRHVASLPTCSTDPYTNTTLYTFQGRCHSGRTSILPKRKKERFRGLVRLNIAPYYLTNTESSLHTPIPYKWVLYMPLHFIYIPASLSFAPAPSIELVAIAYTVILTALQVLTTTSEVRVSDL